MNNPVLITRGIVIFPNTKKKLIIGREKSIKAILAAKATNNQIFVFSQKDPNKEDPKLNVIPNSTLNVKKAPLDENEIIQEVKEWLMIIK